MGRKLKRDSGSNFGAAETSYRLNDTQMTEVIKWSLCHWGAAPFSVSLASGLSVHSTALNGSECERRRGGMQQTRQEHICLGRFEDNFTTYWRHGHISLGVLCFHYLKWSVGSALIPAHGVILRYGTKLPLGVCLTSDPQSVSCVFMSQHTLWLLMTFKSSAEGKKIIKSESRGLKISSVT